MQLDRYEDALEIKRLVYAAALRMKESEEVIFSEALNLSVALILTGNTAEAITFLGERTPAAQRALGGDHIVTLTLRWKYAMALFHEDDSSLDDINEAINVLKDLAPIAERVLGSGHPEAVAIKETLAHARRCASDHQSS